MGFGEIYFGECLLLLHNIFSTMSPVLDSEVLEVGDAISPYAYTLMTMQLYTLSGSESSMSPNRLKCLNAGLHLVASLGILRNLKEMNLKEVES